MKGVIIFGVLTGFEIAPCQRPNFGNCQIKSNKVNKNVLVGLLLLSAYSF